jgi:hypothetical protein
MTKLSLEGWRWLAELLAICRTEVPVDRNRRPVGQATPRLNVHYHVIGLE